MNKIILVFSLLILSAYTISFADDNQQVITLKDGSQIKGVLAGIDNGVYTIKTPIIGDVHVNASDVASITSGSTIPVAPPAAMPTNTSASLGQTLGGVPNLDQQVAAGQKQLMNNPQSMQVIQQMAQDPEIMKELSDPALLQAAQTNNYQAVANNPAVQKLMADPKMQAYVQQLQAQQQQQGSSSQ